MATKFFAKAASFSDDGYGAMLAFSDDPFEPEYYVILDLTNEPDEQDLRLGLGGIHIDMGNLQVEGYDLVEDLRETDSGVVISLTADVARKANIDQEIKVAMGSKVIDGIPVSEAVRRFKERLSSCGQG